ncbi:hypothetical protein [Flavobacterium sp. UMI-01]|uniref:hypothetical protein n=1 Tax=Flavobacterium sp. UMI-01 TaxID=1441053 RepID=UPI001C7D5A15|nr:hypothetical protein [Flavobacterium sp. UMI-01]GIZ08330.1 hypothetical protein FUMI01_10570 [Flavobacterium sp. UMI-01]
MNKEQKIRETKTIIRELENSELVLKQSLAVITSRKNALQTELDSLGASSSTRKGNYANVLSDEKKLQILGSLTK